MTPEEAVALTPKELHSSLIRQLLGCLNLNENLNQEKRQQAITETAFLISKEIYGQARENKREA